MLGVGGAGTKDRMEDGGGTPGLPGDRQPEFGNGPAVLLLHAFDFDVIGLNNGDGHGCFLSWVGNKADGFDSGDGAGFVPIRDIAGHATAPRISLDASRIKTPPEH